MKLKFPKNKWFLAFVIAAVLAVAAIVVAIVLGVTSKDSDPGVAGGQQYVEGDEIGVYYYDVMDGEVLLTLSGGNKFTIAGPSINKTGTYTVSGSTITLDFLKDEDGTTTATYNGDTISLVYDNATMSFLKKINYTVSFNVNGGSEIAAAKVVNGKTAVKPADPAKENHVFLGWYADEALTTPYSFDTVTIKADTTVYARWAEKKAGVPEYTISFDLGYEGAEAIEAIPTISGLAYKVPTPEREGYTFGGWWISMYEDRAKLSYAYKEDTVFTADTTLYAIWHDNSSSKLEAPKVSITDTTITWESVDNASSYKITIVDPEGNVVVDNETTQQTIKAFDFAGINAGEYKISVVAISSREENNSEPADRYFANKALDRVSDFHVENGILVFGAVENAEKYTLTIDCGNDNHAHTEFDNGASTTYYLGNCPMQKGGIRITVTAIANGYASSVSKEFVYDKTLDKIGEVIYDKTGDKFVWDAVKGAVDYSITVTIGDKNYTFNNGTSTSFSVAGFTGEITVSVVPVTDGYNSPEATTAKCTKTAPAAPEGLTASGNIISWNTVEGATSYEVNIAGQTVTTSNNSINLVEASLSFVQGQIYTVKVKSINASNESSAYSKEVSVGYFAMNTALTYSKNTVSWSPVLGVNNYQVRVNGVNEFTVTDATSAKVTLTKEGENLIEVRYIYGDTTSDWSSITVNAFAVEYDSRSVAYGVVLVEYLAIGDVMTLPAEGFSYEGYDFAGWYNAPKGASGNGKLYAEGAVFSGNAYTIVYADWTPKTYNVILKTEGFDITNITNEAKEPVTYTKNFTLTVPTAKNTGMYFFAGWFTGPSGTGEQITDENGNSVAPYPFTRDITLYPFYSTNALTFTLQDDDTYAVSKGVTIDSIPNLVIPVTYREKPVTKILESGFSSCYKLETIKIPDTITLVGASAFTSCKALKYIDVYVAKPDEAGTYETVYSDDNGVLIREDVGNVTYLEVVPRAMTGDYVIPSYVEKILPKAFYYSSFTSVTIPNNITSIPKYAFYWCSSLKTIKFEYNRTNPIDLSEDYPFYYCKQVENIYLPANLNTEYTDLKAILNSFDALKAIEVEENGTTYATINGMLTNAAKDTISYCPKGWAGDFTVPMGVTTIGEKAFQGNNNITSVTIPVWVTSIGKNAFDTCYGITEVTFKGSRTDDLTIDEYAFGYTKYVKKVVFEGNGTTQLDTGKVTIGNSAFNALSTAGNANIQTIEIGAGVNIESIEKFAFQRQAKLQSINIDKSARIGKIGEKAFNGCIKLTTITIPATVTEIAGYAFNDCSALSQVNFDVEGATTLTILPYAFANCTRLTSILLPDHLDEFNSAVFEGCDALKKITVNTTNTKYVNDDNGILYGKTFAEDGTTVVLSELLFYPKGLVNENKGVINNLPNTLTEIGSSAFSGNTNLISITIPESVTTIGNTVFDSCENLKEVIFAGNRESLVIGDGAFNACTSLDDSFKLPETTTKIGASAFAGCKFTSFTIPKKTTVIGKAAFYNCTKLKSVNFECDGALTIGSDATNAATGAFSGCSALESISIPKGTTAIGKYAFYNCSALKTVELGKITYAQDGSYTIESNLTTINNSAFQYCTEIESVIIPKSVTTIGSSAFGMKAAATGNLEEVIFEPYGTKELSISTAVFCYNPKITSITFPARTKTIAQAAPAATSTTAATAKGIFAGLNDLAEVNIANDLVDGVKQYFSSVDGVLYDAAQTVLIFCPFANVGRYEGGQPTYELVVPKTVKLVLTYGILNCTKLKTVTFEEYDTDNTNYGKQLLTIGNYAPTSTSSMSSYYLTTTTFAYAAIGGVDSSITTINFPSHLGKIHTGALGSSPETVVDINFNQDANNITLSNYALTNSRAKEINIPGTLKSMGTYMFYGCNFLEDVSFTLPTSSNKKLPDYTFYKCTSLKEYEIPETVTEFGTYVFAYCEAMTSFEIPENVTKIGNYAFYASGLTSIELHPKLSSVGTYLFSKCASLETVNFLLDDEGKTAITKIPNYMFSECAALKNINLEDLALTEIGNSSFYKCTVLTGIDFTAFTELINIGTLAFSYSSLVDVDLSTTKLSKIQTSFNNIATLKTFVFPEGLISGSVNTSAFSNDKALEIVTIPADFDGNNFGALRGHKVTLIHPEEMLYIAIDEFGVIYDTTYQTLYYAGLAASLDGYTVPETVITISDYAFAYATAKEFALPEGVSSIGTYTFHYAEIEHITIPASVTEIGKYAFAYSDIKTVTFANEHQSKLKSIGQHAFRQTALESIVLPDNVETIDVSLFMDCTNLKSVTFSAALKVIPGNTLGGCYSIEEIIFQEGLEDITYLYESWAIMNPDPEYPQVKSITIPSTVKTLTNGTFYYFQALETVTFAEGSKLEVIDKYTFGECYALKTIENLPSTITTLGEGSFSNCTSLEAIDLENTTVTIIPLECFYNTPSLATLKLPKNLQEIKMMGFYGTGAVDIYIPATVSFLGTSAFENAASAKTITFAEGSAMSVLGDLEAESNFFKGTTSLETLTLANSVTTIGDHVFENSGVKNIVMVDPDAPSELTTIGNYAFANCPNLKEFNYLDNVTDIGNSAFFCNYSLEKAELSSKLNTIGAMAFGFCTKLPEAYIPANLASIGGNPYAGLDASKVKIDPANPYFIAEKGADGSVTIYDTEKSLLIAVFGASGSYVISDSVSFVTPGAFANNAITDISFPKKFNTIPDFAFMNCTQLTSITIEEGITDIGSYAFYNTGLANFTVPKTVKTIGDYAFAYSKNLNNVFIPKSVTNLGNYCFAYCAALSDFEFDQSSTSYQYIGTHFFYNCINIKEVVLPAKVRMTDKDVEDCGSYSSYSTNAIPSYMFAGTGIVNAVIPDTVTYYFARGVFAGCKDLETITFLKNPSTSSYPVGKDWIDGCDKFKYAAVDTIDNKYLYMAEQLYNAGMKELHINTIKAEDTLELATTAYLYKVGEDFVIRFDTDDYKAIIDYFSVLTKTWTAQIYDCNGNRLYCAEDSGNVAYVEDAQGNVIWGEKPAK